MLGHPDLVEASTQRRNTLALDIALLIPRCWVRDPGGPPVYNPADLRLSSGRRLLLALRGPGEGRPGHRMVKAALCGPVVRSRLMLDGAAPVVGFRCSARFRYLC